MAVQGSTARHYQAHVSATSEVIVSQGFMPTTPKVGDVAYIVDTHQVGHAYEVECSDPTNGEMLWFDAMFIDELVAWSE